MHEQYSQLITGLPLFKGYTSDGAQRLINTGEIKEHPAGEVVFKEGDAPTGVYLVLAGKLQVYVEREGQELILTDAGPGTILGELAVLCGLDRAASVRVVEPSSVLEWTAEDFRSILLKDAFLSQRIFRQSLRTLIEKERSLIASLTHKQSESAPK